MNIHYRATPDLCLFLLPRLKRETLGQREHIALYSNLFTEAGPQSFLLECQQRPLRIIPRSDHAHRKFIDGAAQTFTDG